MAERKEAQEESRAKKKDAQSCHPFKIRRKTFGKIDATHQGFPGNRTIETFPAQGLLLSEAQADFRQSTSAQNGDAFLLEKHRR